MVDPEVFETEFPEFFRDVYCGVCCPDKWEHLVMALCKLIRWRLKNEKRPLTDLKVAQVKEKFGGLRFYYDLEGMDDSYIDGAVSMTESMSFQLNKGPAAKRRRSGRAPESE